MRADFTIGGAGGGGSSGGGLSESDDSLKATSYAQVLDLVSEGEIGGLVDGLKSIYLDGTPVQNADGSLNYTNVIYKATTGTQSQAAISGYDDVRNEISVAVEVKASTGPITRSITNTTVTSVIVTVQFPILTKSDSSGNIGGTSVNFAIDVNNNGGGWVETVNDTVTGKSSSAYERQYRVILPSPGPWQIRVRRITADSTSTLLNNKTYWQSYTEIIDAKLRYPNSALVALKIPSAQFSSIPTRGFDAKLLLIKFPTNATVRADGSLSYSGTWDGTFQVGWCADPAWCYYDLVNADRYGLGDFIDASQVSKWNIYEISRYCAALVPDGFGGTEPRFTCNVWVNTKQEAYKLLADLSSCFRGMAYWGSGAINLVQDAPSDPVYLFTNANVIDGAFKYEGSSAKARHTVALVTWNDPADLYRQKVEYVEDTAGIARYGVVETEVVAFACTSRGQAHRVGKWLLYSERLETELCAFSTGAEGASVRPGDVIKIADQYRAGTRQGGRVKSATSTSVTVDALASAPASGSTLYVVGTDGAVQQVTTDTVTGSTIAVSPALSPVPANGAAWVLATASVDAQTFRVLTVAETVEGEHQITALAHNPDKYDAVENDVVLQVRSITSLNPVPGIPTGLAISQGLATVQGVARMVLTATWSTSSDATSYVIDWRAGDGNWQRDTSYSTEYDLTDILAGDYSIKVTALNASGLPSAGSASATFTVTSDGGVYSIIGQGDLATTNKSALPFGTDNRVRFSLFEKGGAGWGNLYNPAGLTVTAYTASDTGGVRLLKLQYTSTASGQQMSLGSLVSSSFLIPVTPGEALAVSFGAQLTGTAGSINPIIGWHNASGTPSGSAALSGTSTTIGGVATLYRAIVTVPAGIYYARIECYATSTGAGTASIAITQPMIIGVALGQSVFPNFTPGQGAEYGGDVTATNVAAAIVGQGVGAVSNSLSDLDPTAAATLAAAAAANARIATSGSILSLKVAAGASIAFSGTVSTVAGGTSGTLKALLQWAVNGSTSFTTFATGPGTSVGASEPGTDDVSGTFTNSTGTTQVFDFKINALKTPGTAGGAVIQSQSYIST